jgi:hypothetical protein
MRNEYNILGGNLEEKRSLGRHRRIILKWILGN